jgi:hypothetical protein
MTGHCIHTVWGNPDEDLDDVFLVEHREGQANAPSPIFHQDPISGSSYPDDNWTEENLRNSDAVVHGKHLVNSSNAQSPLPMVVGGGDAFGPTGKYPATMGVGSDCVSQVTRYQRYPAIARIRPESTGTIGSVARQSYNYVREQMPVKLPFNGFGNPSSPTGEPNNVRQIDSTIPPALEPPRYNYTGLDTEYLQQEYDLMLIRAAGPY